MIQNATIQSTELGGDERGPSFWLHLDYGGAGQGFGGYRLGGEFAHYVVTGILDTLEVASWEKLKGTPVRAKIEDGTIVSIGHYLKDQWFTPKDFKEDCDHCYPGGSERESYCKHCGENL